LRGPADPLFLNMISLLRRFPLQVALATFIVYALTLSHGVTLTSLSLTAKVAGWDWQPMNSQPLLWLLTLPLRLLPSGWVASGLNLFSALCGALTLGILARSLELADWDRPLPMLGRWQSKLPIILACVVCGLEFNFWQEATAATGAMLENLLFAAAIFCLFKFRSTREFRWLQAATFIWGLGMAENWMMILTLPLFLGAVLWLGQLPLLKKDLLLRLALAGLAGFSIFVILPLWNGLSPHSPWGFGEAWLNAFKNYKHLLVNVYGVFWRTYRMISLAVMLYFLVPILPAIIRMRDLGTLDKPPVDQFQIWIYRSLRLAILLACLWLAFDPLVGPRQIVFNKIGLALPFLSLDYLTGIGTGMLAGNLMLAIFAKPKEIYRPPNILEIFFERAVVPGFIILLTLVSFGLLTRNTPAITLANRQPLARFGESALRDLPPGGIMLSDDPQRLLVFQAAAAAQGRDRDWLALDTRSLASVFYRRQVANKRPGDWLTNLDQGLLNSAGMLKLISGLAQSNSIYYLNRNFSYLSEVFYQPAAGLAFGLEPYAENAIHPPPLTAETMAQNEKYWDAITPQLDALQQVCAAKMKDLNPARRAIYQRFHFQPVPPAQSHQLGEWYSVALDDWGVQLQRAGRLAAAKKRFEQALALDAKNVAADVNLQSNTNLAAGTKQDLANVDTLGASLGSFQSLARFNFAHGPVDEPAFCYLLGNACYQAGLPRQSIQQFERAQALAPDIQAPLIALIRLYTHYGREGQAQELINRLRTELPAQPEKNALDAELSLLEANTWLAQTNPANASGVLQMMVKKHPDDARIADVALRSYISFGDYTNALQLVSRRLNGNPDDLPDLFSQASLYLKLGQFSNALPVLDHALTLSNLPPIRLTRAVARIESGQFAAAEADYLELEKTATNNLPIYTGLAEIASRRHDTNHVIEYLERCLAELPTNAPQCDLIVTRLNALKSPGAKM
jgi:tetratricopeptide (TPR) repeat protein